MDSAGISRNDYLSYTDSDSYAHGLDVEDPGDESVRRLDDILYRIGRELSG